MRAKNYYPQTTKISKNGSGVQAIRTLFLVFVLLAGAAVNSFAAPPSTPTFVNGRYQNYAGPLCTTPGTLNFTSYLTITDPSAESLTWTIVASTSHGPSTGAYTGAVAASTPTNPGTNFLYTPNTGYTGSDSITITIDNGTNFDTTTIVFTINPYPATITGPSSVCRTQSIALSSTPGGTWSSNNTFRATVDGSGNVYGVPSATTFSNPVVITHTISGCSVTTNITVNPLSVITGAADICAWGSTVTLHDNTIGGLWSSTTAPVATTGGPGNTAVVTAAAPGVAIITYTMPTGCAATTTLTVNPLPDPIIVGSSTSVCVGSMISFSDQTGGGTWSTSNASIATVDASGNVTGVSGTSNVDVIYTLPTGCTSVITITVNELPSAITPTNACLGQTVSLFSLPGGGTWSTSSTSVSLTPSGDITGVSLGTASVTYTTPAGCTTTASVTINPLPDAISGATTLCQGSSVTLSDAGGGSWSIDNSSVATIDAISGILTGTAGGSAIVTYTLPTGCVAVAAVTVNPIGVISGTNHVCIGSTVSLSDTPAGGTWSSSNANATIDTFTGVVTGVSWGTTTITYSMSTGCYNTRTETIDSLPTLVGGEVCMGGVYVVPHSPFGGAFGVRGTWSSSNPSVATINTNSYLGRVHGVSPGVDTITITMPLTGCSASATVVVNPIYPITASETSICVGNTATLSDEAAGGTWSNDNTAVATIDASTGVITGVSAGSTLVTYTTPAGCTSMINITVNALPNPITGTFYVCEGLTRTLFATPGGGTWNTSNSLVATVDGSGVVTGVTNGVVDVSYTLGTGCSTESSFTVNPTATISGIPYVCSNGGQTDLDPSISGGIWFVDAGSTGLVTIDPGTGLVTGGISSGVALVDYILPTGCVTYQNVTVGTPPPVTGPSQVCAGSTIALSDIVWGGTWSSDNTSSAVVDASSGVVTGVAGGSANIVYTLQPGCTTSKNITVNALPVVTDNAQICAGSFQTLSHTPLGGTWSSSNNAVATVNVFFPVPGRVYAVSAGVDSVTYTLPNGCATTVTVLVNPIPDPIVGSSFLCPGTSTQLSDATPGGTWTSTNVSNASVGATTGLVTGVSTGFATIRYTLSTGCRVQRFVSVNNTLPAITGPIPSEVCVGQTITLNEIATSGTWSSNLPTIGTVDTAGTVTGVAAGTAIITYSMGGTCRATRAVVVDALSDIIGPNVVCQGSSIYLSDSSFGGSWQMGDNSGIATVDAATGVVTAIGYGSTSVQYVLPTGCTATMSLTVNPIPTAIGGTVPGVCFGDTITLTNGIAGGTWMSSDPSIANIDTFTGMVAGVMSGTVTITYTLPNGCAPATATLNVNALPQLTSPHMAAPICNNTLFTYSPSFDLSGTDVDTWRRDTVIGISNPSTTGTGDPSEVLDNTTTDPLTVEYVFYFHSTVNCVNHDTVKVVVNPTPMLTTPLTNGPICNNTLFEYGSNSLTMGTTYTWFRDTVVGISNSPTSGADTIRETLMNTTPLPVTVTYVDTLHANGCINTQNVTVVVNPTPMLSSPDVAPAICDSSEFTYMATSLTPSVTYTWHRGVIAGIVGGPKNGAGDIVDTLINTTANPVVVTYTDTLWFEGCWNTQTVQVTVNPTPMLSSSLTPPAICDSTLFNYTPTSATTGTTFTWVRPYVAGIGLLAGSGTGNPNEYLVNTTNINVTVRYIYTLTANGCTHVQNVDVVVHPRPRLSSDPGPFTTCSESLYTYGPTGYVLGTSFAWHRFKVAGVAPTTGSGTGLISETLVDSTFIPKVVNYVIVMTANGCSDSTSIGVTINPTYDVPDITTHSASTVCLGAMYQNFGVATAAPEGVQYIWTGKNATIYATGNPDQYAIVNFDSVAGPAVVTVTANVIGYTCTTSKSFNVNVSSSEADHLQIVYYNFQFMLLNNDQDNYQWGFDDDLTMSTTILTNETNQTYYCSAPDFKYRHYFVVTNHNGCLQKTYYNPPTGVSTVGDDMTVKVYPNPANDVLNVDINTNAGGKFEVEVFDVLGQRINTVKVVNHKASINVADLAAGVYVIECYRDGVKINSARFIKN